LQCLVVLRLMLIDQAFYRDAGERGIPAGRLRSATVPHAAVAVCEGMDELELVVKHGTGNQSALHRSPATGRGRASIPGRDPLEASLTTYLSRSLDMGDRDGRALYVQIKVFLG
jgi:hypothetical protein